MLEILDAALGDPRTPVLPPFSAVLPDDAPAVATAEGERGPMLASLIAAGRLVPDRGRVLLDGVDDPAAIRRAIALVDTPVVAEPAASMPVAAIVREELRFAGRRSGRTAALAVLDGLGLAPWARRPVGDLPPDDRLRLLLDLAARRPGVRAMILTAPERHGGRAEAWITLARSHADRGMPVLVLGGAAAPRSTGTAPTGAVAASTEAAR